MKYIKKVKIVPNFNIEFEILSQGHRKKIGPKIKKIYIYFAECHGALGKVDLKKKFAECLALALGKISFKKLKKKLPSAQGLHSAKSVFKK